MNSVIFKILKKHIDFLFSETQYLFFQILGFNNECFVKLPLFRKLFPKQTLLYFYIKIYFYLIDPFTKSTINSNIQKYIREAILNLKKVPYLSFRGFVKLDSNLGFWIDLLFHKQKFKISFKKKYMLPENFFHRIQNSKFIKKYSLPTYKMATYEYNEDINKLVEKIETKTKFFFYEIENALLTGNGYIIPESIKFEYFFTNKLFEDIEKELSGGIKEVSITPSCVSHPAAILLNPPACNNYYHWLIETLSHFKDLDETKELSNIPIVVSTEMPGQHYELLELLIRNSNRKIIWINKQEQLKFKKLYVLTNPAYLPEYLGKDHYNYCKISPDHLIYMRNKIFKEIEEEKIAGKKIKRVFIDRGSRGVTNMKSFKKLLKKYKFKIIRMEKLCIKKQIKIFKDAEIIMGVTGAAFSNIIFCNPNAKIITLSSKYAKTSCLFSTLGGIFDLNFHLIACEPKYKVYGVQSFRYGKYGYWFTPIKVNINEVKGKLELLIKNDSINKANN